MAANFIAVGPIPGVAERIVVARTHGPDFRDHIVGTHGQGTPPGEFFDQ